MNLHCVYKSSFLIYIYVYKGSFHGEHSVLFLENPVVDCCVEKQLLSVVSTMQNINAVCGHSAYGSDYDMFRDNTCPYTFTHCTLDREENPALVQHRESTDVINFQKVMGIFTLLPFNNLVISRWSYL